MPCSSKPPCTPAPDLCYHMHTAALYSQTTAKSSTLTQASTTTDDKPSKHGRLCSPNTESERGRKKPPPSAPVQAAKGGSKPRSYRTNMIHTARAKDAGPTAHSNPAVKRPQKSTKHTSHGAKERIEPWTLGPKHAISTASSAVTSCDKRNTKTVQKAEDEPQGRAP
mmetsp:Transcript_42024/g.65706  ORF Transcript_42024/g.65706 Transcript_42024/m.65706 type:complete len:167 (-) Transcript_42024:451-951(-)